MTPRIDDSCLGQDQPDQADMSQLFGNLSMKKGRSVNRWTLARSEYSSPSALS